MLEATHEFDPISLILMDYQMPGMDGFQTARLVRSDARFAQIPMLLLSSGARSSAADIEARGFAGSLAKPIRKASLRDLLMRIVSGQDPALPSGAGAKVPGRGSLQGVRVLLAEDNPINQMVARRILEQWGCIIECVASGRQALEAATTAPFDVVLMDMQMPDMDGLEATAAIRNWEKGSSAHVPIIALTANVMASDRDRCIGAGMDDYLGKPLRAEALYAAVAKWTGMETTLVELATPRQAPYGPVWDREALASLSPEDDSFVQEMVEAFLTEARSLVDKLRRQADDLAAVEATAHALKGAALSVGALQLAEAAKLAEFAGKAGEAVAAAEAIEHLEQAFQTVAARMRVECEAA